MGREARLEPEPLACWLCALEPEPLACWLCAHQPGVGKVADVAGQWVGWEADVAGQWVGRHATGSVWRSIQRRAARSDSAVWCVPPSVLAAGPAPASRAETEPSRSGRRTERTRAL